MPGPNFFLLAQLQGADPDQLVELVSLVEHAAEHQAVAGRVVALGGDTADRVAYAYAGRRSVPSDARFRIAQHTTCFEAARSIIEAGGRTSHKLYYESLGDGDELVPWVSEAVLGHATWSSLERTLDAVAFYEPLHQVLGARLAAAADAGVELETGAAIVLALPYMADSSVALEHLRTLGQGTQQFSRLSSRTESEYRARTNPERAYKLIGTHRAALGKARVDALRTWFWSMYPHTAPARGPWISIDGRPLDSYPAEVRYRYVPPLSGDDARAALAGFADLTSVNLDALWDRFADRSNAMAVAPKELAVALWVALTRDNAPILGPPAGIAGCLTTLGQHVGFEEFSRFLDRVDDEAATALLVQSGFHAVLVAELGERFEQLWEHAPVGASLQVRGLGENDVVTAAMGAWADRHLTTPERHRLAAELAPGFPGSFLELAALIAAT